LEQTFSVFFDIEFEYEVSFSLAIAVSVAEGEETIIFKTLKA
jgi:hypothetical protein